MFFQVNITPEQKKCPSEKTENVENKVVNRYSLILAPFQKQTHITLETQVNNSAQCFISLKNISSNSLKLSVTKQPPSDRRVSLNALEFNIDGNSELVLEITWCPEKDGIFRDVLELTDSRRLKHSIALNLTAKDTRRVIKSRKNLNKKKQVVNPSSILSTNSYNSRQSVNQNRQVKETKELATTATTKAVETTAIQSVKRKLCNLDKIDFDKENQQEKEPTYAIPQLEITHVKRIKKQDYSVHDFSSIINSKFHLSPLNAKSLASLSKDEHEQPNFRCSETIVIQQTKSTIRRETFDVVPAKDAPNRTQLLATSELNDCSFIVNQINLSTIHTPRSKFSPTKCSTVSKNKTFNVHLDSHDKSDSLSSSFKSNATYDLSPDSSTISSCPKLNLQQSLEALSPIKRLNQSDQSVGGSPIKVDCSFNNCSNILNKLYDQSSVREVIEADLWATSTDASVSLPARQHLQRLKRGAEKESLNKTFVSPATKTIRQKRPFKMEISPPIKPVHKMGMLKTISPRKKCKLTKEKLESTLKKKVQINKNTTVNNLDIPGVKITKVSAAGIIRKRDDCKSEKIIKNVDNKDIISRLCVPDPFSATTMEDPFLSSKIYYDEKWICQQEIEFTKWLNAMLTAPEHLSSDVDAEVIDIGKLWQSCRQKEDVVLAKTKETISARYHTDMRLNTLRKAACAMFRNKEVAEVLLHTNVGIEKGIFIVRKDCNLHKDIGLQKTILELFLSYNPLWLRISLETIYNETIPLHSNNDLVGLTQFLLGRFFSDPHLIKEHSYSNNLRRPSFFTHLNKFILQKFFFIIYFLDYAKNHKLIRHDPCLFRKKSTIKDSRSILLAFAREVLSGIGDVTKVLRGYSYVVSHKQTYLDEYDYAVLDLSCDLRDGVKLCRTMEVLTSQNDLMKKCRVPAISRLQKVHNVEVALKALKSAGYELIGDIDAKSIVDGHREKTLSLLWQIIYKFLKPMYEKAAIKLQRWWRAKLWPLRIKNMLKRRKELAAIIIQKHWRRYLAQKKVQVLREELRRQIRIQSQAAVKIQRFWKLEMQKRRKLQMQKAASKIQRRWRDLVVTRPYVRQYRQSMKAIVKLQQRFRANVMMRRERRNFLSLRQTAIKIQRRYRAKCAAVEARRRFMHTKAMVVFLQRKWRATKVARQTRKEFLEQVNAAKYIQLWWRASLARKQDRNNFLILKGAVRTVESHWLARTAMKKECSKFLETKRQIIVIQRAWRRFAQTRADIAEMKKKKQSIVSIQAFWRAKVARKRYQLMKGSCAKIQNWWRAILAGKSQKFEYQKTKNATIVLQKQWRMRTQRKAFLRQKNAAMKIQKWYRDRVSCRPFEKLLIDSKLAATVIQRWWINTKIKKRHRQEFVQFRQAIIKIQKCWRESLMTKRQRLQFLKLKDAAIRIQSHWKMLRCRRDFMKKRQSVRRIQNWWRQKLVYKRQEKACKNMENVAARKIQSLWRGYKVRKTACQQMRELRTSTAKATAAANSSTTIATKIHNSVRILKFPNSVGQLTVCLYTLDTVTRLSPDSCVLLCTMDVVTTIYDVYSSYNRSLPLKDACLGASNVLINIAKYSRTVRYVTLTIYAETLTSMLAATCEKQLDLYFAIATLFWLLTNEDDYAAEVSEQSPTMWYLKKVQTSLAKIKQKPSTECPSILPDWNLSRQPRLFSNPHRALNMILKNMNEH